MPAEGTGLPVIGTEIAGKYRVESVLGQGGMGTVYAARNVLTGKRVAIKWLLPEHAGSSTRERLLREAQIASSIDHPNVVDIYDVGEHEGGLFLVMEYLRGKPLSEVMAERGRMEPGDLVALLVPAMRGVHAAHLAGVIHRDLKPENIILSESDGQIVPKVVDFGVSKTIGASSVPNSSLTRTGALVGTPHYMALEQVDGSNAIDARTDVYAFGVLLYRALTGHYPFDGTSLGEVILKIGTKEAAPMRMLRPELPPGLDAIVLRSLSRPRDKRFPDLEQMARALVPFAVTRRLGDSMDTVTAPGAVDIRLLSDPSGLSAQTGDSGPQPAASSVSALEARGARRRVLVVGAAMAVIVLAVAGALLARRDATPAGDGSTAASKASEPNAVGDGKAGAVAGEPARAAALAEEPGAGAARGAVGEPEGTTNDVAAAGALAPSANEQAGATSATVTSPALANAAAELPGARTASQGGAAQRASAAGARVEARAGARERNDVDRRAAHERQKPARTTPPTPPPAVHKSNTPAVIRGERTNGFSTDEF